MTYGKFLSKNNPNLKKIIYIELNQFKGQINNSNNLERGKNGFLLV